jgi:hypothetical protein
MGRRGGRCELRVFWIWVSVGWGLRESGLILLLGGGGFGVWGEI